MKRPAFTVLALLVFSGLSFGDDSERLLTIDHYVRVKSTVPAIAGQDVSIYVRERVPPGSARASATVEPSSVSAPRFEKVRRLFHYRRCQLSERGEIIENPE